MTKEPDKSSWENNYNNKSISGIEVRNKSGKLVNFITIKHDEILENKVPHRITIKLNENAEPVLPPPQTFEEIIQAKRRQQMLLYGSGSSSGAILSDRRARQASAAARQIATAAASSSRSRSLTSLTNSSRSNRSNISRRRSGGSSSRRRSSKKKVPPPKQTNVPTSAPAQEPLTPTISTPAAKTPSPPKSSQATSGSTKKSPSSSQKASSPSTSANRLSTVESAEDKVTQPTDEPKPGSSHKPLITSLKDLHKDHPLFKTVDPKEVKFLLKLTEPGALVELPDGTIIRKSRRGGARAGAGRKRSRPVSTLNDLQQASTSGESQQPLSCNTSSSFSSQA